MKLVHLCNSNFWEYKEIYFKKKEKKKLSPFCVIHEKQNYFVESNENFSKFIPWHFYVSCISSYLTFFFFLVFLPFLEPLPTAYHMEVCRLGV